MSDDGSRAPVSTHELDVGGDLPLRYALAVPEGGGAGDPAPLVIALHYGWQGRIPPRHFRDFLRVFAEPAFASLGAVIAAPQCPGTSWRQAGSERAVLALREHLLDSGVADSQRVLLTGFSLGGMGTWFLASHHPQSFPLAVPVAAVPVLQRGSEDRSGLNEYLAAMDRGEPPIWHDGLANAHFFAVNSRADELIPFAAAEHGVRALQRRGADIELLALDDVGHYESARFAAAMDPVRTWVARAWCSGHDR